jgi:hypothetical protein
MFNTLMGRFGGFTGVGGSNYLGTKKIVANTALTFPSSVGFAVVKMFGGKSNGGQGGFTVIKLGRASAGQTYYITTDGQAGAGPAVVIGNSPPGSPGPTHIGVGTWANHRANTSTHSQAEPGTSATFGGGYVSISTGPMAPGGAAVAAEQASILGISGGGGGQQPQPGSGGGGSAGYPAGQDGTNGAYFTLGFGVGGNQGDEDGIYTRDANPHPIFAPAPPSGQASPTRYGSGLRGNKGEHSPPEQDHGATGGGGGAGYIGGGGGAQTPSGAGRGAGGGGGSNYYVPSSNPHLSSIANNVYSRSIGYDTNDPDYAAGYNNSNAPALPTNGPIPTAFKTLGLNTGYEWGSTGYAVIKFFTGDEEDYDSVTFPSSQPTAPHGF